MKTATLIVLLAVLACRFSLSQTPAQQEVLQFERDACKAFLDADVAALERVLTARFHADGLGWRSEHARG